jgi:hypothetical protein
MNIELNQKPQLNKHAVSSCVYHKIDFCIKATKDCTKALMKLSFKNYCNNEKPNEKISNKTKLNNNY